MIHDSVPHTRTVEKTQPASTAEHKTRMIAAIAERSDATWFFKLTGSIAAVGQLRESWDQFLRSIRFNDAGNPTWQLPDKWEAGPAGSAMRFATLRTGPEPDALEVSVSSLPPNQDLLSNVNRWRGQLGVSPIGPVQLESQLPELDIGETHFRIFDQTGPNAAAGMSPPFAGGAGAATGADVMAAPHPVVPTNSQINFAAPEGWQPGETSLITKGRWSKHDGDQQVELMVLEMNNSDESWKMNIEAWSNQLGLAQAPDVSQLTEQVQVAGEAGRKIRFDNPDTKQSVVAVMFAHGSNGWLVKFWGSTGMVDSNLKELDGFLESVSF